MEINLIAKQTEAWDYFEDAETEELGYGGAAGGGKTRLGCYLSLYIADQFPGSRGGLGRKELKNLKRTTLASFFEVAAEQKLRAGIDFNYNQQDSMIRFPNGSEMVLFDTAYQPTDPLYTRFGSYELTWCWIDESNESPFEAIQILKTRVGRKNIFNGKEVKPFFLETFNPNKGHVYNRYYKPYKNGILPPYRKFVAALPGDNHHLPKSYIENLKRADTITRERLLYGNFEYDDDDTKLMGYDKILDIFSNFVIDSKDKFITADIARFGKDKTIIYVWKGWSAIKRREIAKSDLQEVVAVIEKLREEFGISKSNVLVDEAGVGGGVVDFGRYKGFLSGAAPIQKEKDKKVNYLNLKAQCYYGLAEIVNDSKLNIACDLTGEQKQHIIEDLDSIKAWNVDKEGKLQIIPKEKQKEALSGRSPDDGDTLAMRYWFELSPSNNSGWIKYLKPQIDTPAEEIQPEKN